MQNRSLTPSPVSGSSEIPKFSSPFTQRKGYRESSATICSRTSPLSDRVLAVFLVSSSLNGREQVEGHNPSNVCCCSQNLFIFGLSLVGYVILCVRLQNLKLMGEQRGLPLIVSLDMEHGEVMARSFRNLHDRPLCAVVGADPLTQQRRTRHWR